MSLFRGSWTEIIFLLLSSKGFFITWASANKFCFMGERGNTTYNSACFFLPSIQSQSIWIQKCRGLKYSRFCWFSSLSCDQKMSPGNLKSAFPAYRQKVIIYLQLRNIDLNKNYANFLREKNRLYILMFYILGGLKKGKHGLKWLKLDQQKTT